MFIRIIWPEIPNFIGNFPGMATSNPQHTARATLNLSYLIVLLLMTFPGPASSQITFERNYGTTEDDIGRCVRQTSDGGYIISGYTKSSGASNYDAFVIRTDEWGDTLWTKTLGGPGYDVTYALTITSDNGYLVCGSYLEAGQPQSDIWLIRLNEDGDTLWTKHNYSTFSAAAYSVQLLSSGGFIVTGTREDAAGNGHMFILETDASGNQLWTEDYPFWANSGGNAVVVTNDDGFLICGYIDTYNPTWNRNLGMVKINNQGDTVWTRQFGGQAMEMGWTACESASGGYLAAGYTTGYGNPSGDAYLVKTSDLGQLEWQQHFGKSGLDVIYDICNTDDLNYIATGISGEQGSEFQEAWLLKIDPSGDTIWTHSYGGLRKSYGYSVRQTSDAGYVFCGSTNASGNNIYDVMLVKTNPDGLITSIDSRSSKKAGLRIFPNPSDGNVTIEIPAQSDRLIISNSSGKIIHDKPVMVHDKQTIDLQNLSPGVYFVTLMQSEVPLVETLVIR